MSAVRAMFAYRAVMAHHWLEELLLHKMTCNGWTMFVQIFAISLIWD
jgi:hypothetical protein